MKHNIKKVYITPFITITVFLLIIFMASYAYYNSGINVNNVTNIVANIPNYSTSIISSGDECILTVNASDMLQSNADNNTPVATATCHLNVTLNGTPGIPYIYGVVLEETSATRFASVSNASHDEFKYNTVLTQNPQFDNNSINGGLLVSSLAGNEYLLVSSTVFNGYDVDFLNTYSSLKNGIKYYDEENDENISLNSVSDSNIRDMGIYLNNLTSNNDRLAPLGIGIISIPTGSNTVTQTYTFTEKWFNIESVDQSAHANKTYTFKLKVVNVTDYLTNNNPNSGSTSFTGTIYRSNNSTTAYGTSLVSKNGWCLRVSNDDLDLGGIDSCNDANLVFNSQNECENGLSNLNVQGSCYQGSVSGFSQYVTSQNDISSLVYLKHDIVNNTIVATYTCIGDGTIEACLKGGDLNQSYYGSYTGMDSNSTNTISGNNPTGNLAMMSQMQGYFSSMFSGQCQYGDNTSDCNYSILKFGAGTDKNANIYINYDNYQCMISLASLAGCWN